MTLGDITTTLDLTEAENKSIDTLGGELGITDYLGRSNLTRIFERAIIVGAESTLIDCNTSIYDASAEELRLVPNLYEHIEGDHYQRQLRLTLTVQLFGNDRRAEAESLRVYFAPNSLCHLTEEGDPNKLVPYHTNMTTEQLDAMSNRSLTPASRKLLNMASLMRQAL